MSKPDAAKMMRDRAIAALDKTKGKVPNLQQKPTPRKWSGKREPKTRGLKAPYPGNAPPRLPDGSYFEVYYYDAKNMWEGTLAIGGGDPHNPVAIFNSSASAVFKLLEKLDRMYRDWLEKGAVQ